VNNALNPVPVSIEDIARSFALDCKALDIQPHAIPVYVALGNLDSWLEELLNVMVNANAEQERAAAWVLDNDYQIRRALRQIKKDMPLDFYHRLPAMAAITSDKQLHHYPRIWYVARSVLQHTRMQLSPSRMQQFIEAFQQVQPLNEAELWAFPALLRLACIEQIVWASQQLVDKSLSPESLRNISPLTDVASESPDVPCGPLVGLDPTEVISGCVVALISIHDINWLGFVESTSHIESLLSEDPAAVYAQMDQGTRVSYRETVEELSRQCALNELEVCDKCLQLAGLNSNESPRNHVGYWLRGDGRRKFEQQLELKKTHTGRLRQWLLSHQYLLYFGGLCLMMVLLLVLPVAYLTAIGSTGTQFFTAIILLLMPATVVSTTIVQWLVTTLLPPDALPALDPDKFDFSNSQTAVAVPFIAQTVADVEETIETLELRYIANPESFLHYVLLSDLPDAPMEQQSGDQDIENALVKGIKTLNQRHASKTHTPFLLLHRRRQYNPSESCWMGWERKRGKIEQFNALLLGGDAKPFQVTEGRLDEIKRKKYVICLDADTLLPQGTAARLICTLAHPLNSPKIDHQTQQLLSGYTILQPRVEALLSGESSSMFAQLFSGDCAIDIYSRAVSNVYQDLFGDATFVGKGIYEIRAFEQSLAGRIPENHILSHDLFEGNHGRVGLVSSVVLYEGYPETWEQHATRLHRWIRGDWQLLPWLGSKVPDANLARVATQFDLLGRWKILDNLRRSLVPFAMLLLFISGWFFLPGHPAFWTLLGIAVYSFYLFNQTVAGLVRATQLQYSRGFWHLFREQLSRSVLSIAFIFTDSFIALDAIGRTLWRMVVSHRSRLQWRAAVHRQDTSRDFQWQRPMHYYVWASTAGSVLLAVLLFKSNPVHLAVATPVLFGWFVVPALIVWLSKPRRFRRQSLTASDQQYLRDTARRTWHYFEVFADPQDNWLPPDNYQPHANVPIAHRTSPTNIGLYLTATLTANDLGYIGARELEVRSRNLLDTLAMLPTHRGHLLNWYDTRTLEPLEPRYVSTVDSGNLAVCLLAYKQGCIEKLDAPLFDNSCIEGLADTFNLLENALDELGFHEHQVHRKQVDKCRARLQLLAENKSFDPSALKRFNHTCWRQLEQLIGEAVTNFQESDADLLAELHNWLERIDHHLHNLERDVEDLYPWWSVFEHAPKECGLPVEDFKSRFDQLNTLRSTESNAADLVDYLNKAIESSNIKTEEKDWCEELKRALHSGVEVQGMLLNDLLKTADDASALACSMDFKWLYDESCHLFYIGFNLSTGLMDENHYDLLASEARMASFFAIAKRDVPLKHWFHLGRPVIRLSGKPALQSWSGSMFEYLMPPLFLPGKRDTLLGETESLAVKAQRDQAHARKLPWGISESAFSVTDAEGNYQYRAFGTPALGIRRGLSEDYVVAPYASTLALAVWPVAAVDNLRRLQAANGLGRYGFVDALDYTPDRLGANQSHRVVETWMAHHQGMSLVAIVNVLNDDVMARRLLSDKSLQSISLLLQEKIPWSAPLETARKDELALQQGGVSVAGQLGGWIPAEPGSIPQWNLLGNGRLATRASRDGRSVLLFQDHTLTRLGTDQTRNEGEYRIHWSDSLSGNKGWLGDDNSDHTPGDFNVVFNHHEVDIMQQQDGLRIRMENTVAAHADMDIRRINITNDQKQARTVILTSHAEVVLAPRDDDERHPAFSKLFVSSRVEAEVNGLSYARRSRNTDTAAPVMLHRVVFEDEGIEFIDSECDRQLWRGRRTYTPAQLHNNSTDKSLSVSSGNSTAYWTMDPVMALKVSVRLEPGSTRQLAFVTAAGTERNTLLQQAHKTGMLAIDRLFTDAAMNSALEIQRQGIEASQLPALQNLASAIMHPQAALREVRPLYEKRLASQPDLWSFGVSGDLPLLVLRMDDDATEQLLELLVRTQSMWRQRGLQVDLVVLRIGEAGYEEPVREKILDVLRDTHNYGWLGRNGGVHVVSSANLSSVAMDTLLSSACVILDSEYDLTQRLEEVLESRPLVPQLIAVEPPVDVTQPALVKPDNLLFDNGLGGFDEANKEYVIHLEPGQTTPTPWCNVLANEQFGALVSEAGLGCTWSVNSGEHRLTPWSNDPVADPQTEMLWLRDEASAEVWSVTPAPEHHTSAIQVRHGLGYTKWRRHSHGLEQEQLVCVAANDPVKLYRLRLRNCTSRVRRITATAYVEWMLGAVLSKSKLHVGCGYDPALQAIMAGNHWNPEFKDRIAFLSSSLPPHSVTGDRLDFIGNQTAEQTPAGLLRSDLGGSFSDGSDACAAYQVHLDIEPDDTAEVLFVLGEGADRSATEELIKRFRSTDMANSALKELAAFWMQATDSVRIKTPDKAFDLLINHWLTYQLISCRLFARGAFYQAGGAYGFRDQLQDVLALIGTNPSYVRDQIVRAAAHQFEEGDALHWWHPPTGRGVRTRISDDYLWLAYVTARYVEGTGDESILDDEVAFLKAPLLADDEEDRYAQHEQGTSATVFEHCCRAIDHSLPVGAHGLPLMGSGDWNDGMDRIGHQGRGESIWLAWFHIALVKLFAPLAEQRGEDERVQGWCRHAQALKESLDQHAWDGDWYLRAFDDEGEPWGSKHNDECQIDVIAQAWSALSGFKDEPRTKTALQSADTYLFDRELNIVRLLTPPFNNTARNPGYIKSYPPGIRENGGQYTHAATWLGLAFTELGDGDRALEVFDCISPVKRCSDAEGVKRFRREPYVLSADIGGTEPIEGRGGWSWYTGAASWTWQLGVNGILGIEFLPNAIRINPCLPKQWPHVEVMLNRGTGSISLRIENPNALGSSAVELLVDGLPQAGSVVTFPNTNEVRRVVATILSDEL